MTTYAVVFERTDNNYAAYVPDLSGCVATGRTRKEVEGRIREAIELHLDGMREDGEIPPRPTTSVATVEL